MRAALAARDENLTDRKLFADVKLLNDLSISTNVFFHKIFEKASPLSNELQKAHTTVMVLLMPLEVRRQHIDMGGEYGDLNLGVAGVCFALPVLLDELCLLLFADWHCDSLSKLMNTV